MLLIASDVPARFFISNRFGSVALQAPSQVVLRLVIVLAPSHFKLRRMAPSHFKLRRVIVVLRRRLCSVALGPVARSPVAAQGDFSCFGPPACVQHKSDLANK